MLNCAAAPLSEGLLMNCCMLWLVLGPAPLVPAQASQLCQPGMFWIPDFTVCAEALMLIAATIARNAAAIQVLLVGFFCICCLSKNGGIYCNHKPRVFSAAGWSLWGHQLCLNEIQPARGFPVDTWWKPL